MAAGRRAAGLAREHAGQLDHPAGFVEGRGPGHGAIADLGLRHGHLVIGEGGDLGQVGDHQHLAEPAPESLEGEEHAGLAIVVEGAEHLVEHQEADGSARLEADLLADRHPEGKVGQIGLRAREPGQAVLDALVGADAKPATRESFRRRLRDNELNNNEIEIRVSDSKPQGLPMFEVPGQPGSSVGMINIGEMLGKALGGAQAKPRRVTVKDSYAILIAEESDKLLDSDQITAEALRAVENNGIVFLDEIDKICNRSEGGRAGADVSREGVQRDLLPLIEGTTVATKHGPVKTDHILFIASGAFHVAKPADLLPELQGRLPIRVELKPLLREDLRRILTEPEASLVKQYVALLATEGVTLDFTDDAIDAIADVTVLVNSTVENIGARRLQTIMERILDEISFDASDRPGHVERIDAAYVTGRVADLARNTDLSKFIL